MKGEQCFIHGNGQQTKDYIYIEDAVEATINLAMLDFVGPVNIATGKETSVNEIFAKLKELTGSDAKAQHTEFPACGFERGSLSIKKANQLLDWEPKYSFEAGLKLTVEWFKKRV